MSTLFVGEIFDRRCLFCGKKLSACMGFVVPRLLQRFMELNKEALSSPQDICVENGGNRKFTVHVEVCGRCEVILTEVFKICFVGEKEGLETDGGSVIFRGQD